LIDSAPPRSWQRRALLGALAALAALPAAAAEKGEGGEKQEPASTAAVPVFFNVPAIVLPVVAGNTITRQVGAVLTVELAEGHRRSEVAAKERQLTDAFITELYGLYALRNGVNQVVDERLVKRRLLAAADRVLGPGVAHAVLIRQLVEEQH
jgi:hypothetical protein